MSRKTAFAVLLLVLAGGLIWQYSGSFHKTPEVTKNKKPEFCDQLAKSWRACFESRFSESRSDKHFAWPGAKGRGLKLRLVFFIINRENRTVPHFDFYCALPPDSGTMALESIAFNLPARLADDSVGNRFAKISISGLAPRETRMVRMIAALQAAGRVSSLTPDPRYLKSEPYIESDSAEIIGLAKKLKKKTAPATAMAVFLYVSKKIRSLPLDPGLHGAAWCFSHRAGDCTEMALLATALCRAAQIPARTLTGFVVKGDAVVTQKRLHNWAEVFINGRWVVLDPYYSVFDTTAGIYVPFQIFCGNGRTPLELYQIFRVFAPGHRLSVNY